MTIVELATALGSMPRDVLFFFENSGGCRASNECWAESGLHASRRMVAAETWAQDAGYAFIWEKDHCDSSEWDIEEPFYPQYSCRMIDADGETLQSLGCIDFGRDNPEPHGTYIRVVQAELALEEMP